MVHRKYNYALLLKIYPWLLSLLSWHSESMKNKYNGYENGYEEKEKYAPACNLNPKYSVVNTLRVLQQVKTALSKIWKAPD